jgi:hypothetical protein
MTESADDRAVRAKMLIIVAEFACFIVGMVEGPGASILVATDGANFHGFHREGQLIWGCEICRPF